MRRAAVAAALALLAACDPGTTRPNLAPFPTDEAVEIRYRPLEAAERLAEALRAEGIPLRVVSAKDGYMESPWLDAASLVPTRRVPLGVDVVKVRAFVDPGRVGYSLVTLEAAYRDRVDPSRPGRELERPLPADHALRARLTAALDRARTRTEP